MLHTTELDKSGNEDQDRISNNFEINDMTGSPESKKIDARSDAAKFLLKAKEEHKVCQSALNRIVGDVKSLWQAATSEVKEKVLKCTGENSGLCDQLADCFDETTPFDGLESEYNQIKYYKDNLFCKLLKKANTPCSFLIALLYILLFSLP